MTAEVFRKRSPTGLDVRQPSALQQLINSGNNTMELYPDFKELLELLNANNVAHHSKKDFINNKRTTGRFKDLTDIEALGEDPRRTQ